ncbi:hypothetical protein [Rubritalea tangerina]
MLRHGDSSRKRVLKQRGWTTDSPLPVSEPAQAGLPSVECNEWTGGCRV